MTSYVDAIAQAKPAAEPPVNGREVVRIGANSEHEMLGDIDDVRVYARCPQAEINELLKL